MATTHLHTAHARLIPTNQGPERINFIGGTVNLKPNTTVREMALEIPGATRVFERIGIDYCCGGQQSIADACANAETTVEELLHSLELEKISEVSGEESFRTATLAELIDHIVETHHVFCKNEIQRLRALIEKVRSVHGQNHSELARLQSLFETLSTELEPHMIKEELVLFPYVLS